ncbi:hypothetical protein GCM10009690_22760 [Brevibacterium permense]|uniref:Uncharacterized protein n=1 Tax=Brevibacterium permense TaxID=234834 RepID=A0ABP4LCA6_9MICO
MDRAETTENDPKRDSSDISDSGRGQLPGTKRFTATARDLPSGATDQRGTRSADKQSGGAPRDSRSATARGTQKVEQHCFKSVLLDFSRAVRRPYCSAESTFGTPYSELPTECCYHR